jgi:transglutaminase-like putative cysteine protease
MRRQVIIGIIIFFFTLTGAEAQPAWWHHHKIDRYARTTPETHTASPEQLARYLTLPYSRDRDKARAVFAWVAQHIAYDTKAPVAHVHRAALQAPRQVLQHRKAVCEGYANLFQELCRLAGLRAEVVNGYARQAGLADLGSHAWNALLLDGEWKLLDVTWSAGFVNGEGKYQPYFRDTYFLVGPEQFVREHLPYDPVWQLLYRPLSLQDFNQPPGSVLSRGPVTFHYPDTLARMARLDAQGAEEASLRRIIWFDPANRPAQINLTRLQLRKAGHYATLGTEQLQSYLSLTSVGGVRLRGMGSGSSVRRLLDRAEEHFNHMLCLYGSIHTDLPHYRGLMKANEEMARHNLAFIQTEREFWQKRYLVDQLPQKQ